MITLEARENCTGCYGCYNICPNKCISMKSDAEGFWYPKINKDQCSNCGLCEKVCPIINKTYQDNNPIAYGCINKDESKRLQSTSGGVFTLLAEVIIQLGGVVFGAAFNKDFEVEHICISSKKELDLLRGSKYVQSKIGDTFKYAKEYLDKGQKVLYSGTPCQIAALNAFLGKSYDNLYSIDIVCHGVPSPKVWKKYIDFRKKRGHNSIKEISFRNKKTGWKNYSMIFQFGDNVQYVENHKKDYYMKAYLRNISLRPSCYSCNFKSLHRHSDITLADFWGIEKLLAELDDDKGTSLIFINSDKGNNMFQQVKPYLRYKKVDIDEAVIDNSSAIKSVKENPRRDGFFRELDEKDFDKLVKKYCKDSLKLKIKRKIKVVFKL